MLNLDFLTALPDVSAPGSREWLNHGAVHTNGPVMDDELLADPVIAGTKGFASAQPRYACWCLLYCSSVLCSEPVVPVALRLLLLLSQVLLQP
jgi:hypothetical protein